MSQSTIDSIVEEISLSKARRAMPKGACLSCGGLGIIYKKSGYNGHKSSLPIQCPACKGNGKEAGGFPSER